MFDNKWQKKEMPLVSLIGMGGGIASPAFLASIVLNILKPTVFSPADDTGVPDFDYTAESSAITSVGQVVDNTPVVGPDENFNGGTSYAQRLHSVYDPSTQRIVIAYTDWTNNEYGTYVVGQVDGDSITFGTPTAFRNQKCENIRTGYDPVNEKVYIAFVDGGHGGYVSVIAGDVDPTTNSINFGNYISLHGRGGGILGMAYDTTNQNMVVAYHDDTVHRGKIECVTMRDAASNLLGNGPQTEFGYGIVDNISNNGGISSNIVYDPNANRIVIAYSGMDDYDGKVVVGEGTGGSWNDATVNFGSPVRFDNLGSYSGITHGGSSRIRMVYNPDAQKIIIGYRFQHSFDNQASYTSNAQVIAGTVDPSTNTVNFGNSTVFGDLDPRELEIGYDSNSQKMLLAYHPYIGGETNRIDFVAATIDGTTISVEDPVNIGTYSAVPYNTSIAYDSSNQKFVVSHTTSVTGGIANVVSLTSTATQLTLTDTTVSKVSDGSLVGGSTIDQVLTVGETVQADTAVTSTVTAPVFNSVLYTGDGQDNRAITTGIDNTDKSLMWIKVRNETYAHLLTSPSFGAGYHLPLDQEIGTLGLQGHSGGVKSFNEDGVNIGTYGYVNSSGKTYVGWNFRAAPGFFDIVTYTGDGGFEKTISHNLGSVPAFVIIKRTDSSSNWMVGHAFNGGNNWSSTSASFNHAALTLNSSEASTGDSSKLGCKEATSTEFTVYQGNSPASNYGPNHNNATYVAYLFANTPGLIKCGSFSGAGGGTQVDVGFQPKWMMIKSIAATSWVILDKNLPNGYLTANTNDTNGSLAWSFTSTGVTLTDTWNGVNDSAHTYTYVAIAENPEADITSDIYASGTVSASSGNTITLSNTTGTWSTGMKVQGTDSDTKDNPDPINAGDVSLTSSAPTAERNVSTWGDAVWEIATDENFTQNVQTATTALSATGTQAGPSFTLQPNTGYYTRTKYTALGQESEWSDVTYFVTKESSVYADDVFSTFLYTGNGSTITVNNGIDLSGEGGLVWTKSRNNTDNGAGDTSHRLTDTEVQQLLFSDSTAAATLSGYQRTFNSNGFTDSYGWSSGNEIASWTFRKAPGFFDVVTWSGDSTVGRQISHNLGSTPGMILIKNLNSTYNWVVYHRSEGASKYVYLNSNNPSTWASGDYNYFNSTQPTSTHFTVDSGNASARVHVNDFGSTYIAYIFAHDDARFGTNEDESVISCGTFNATSGTQVNIGWEPQFLLAKNVTSANDWSIVDTMRGFTADSDNYLLANKAQPEYGYPLYAPTPTGFTVSFTANNDAYIYMAIRSPHKP